MYPGGGERTEATKSSKRVSRTSSRQWVPSRSPPTSVVFEFLKCIGLRAPTQTSDSILFIPPTPAHQEMAQSLPGFRMILRFTSTSSTAERASVSLLFALVSCLAPSAIRLAFPAVRSSAWKGVHIVEDFDAFKCDFTQPQQPGVLNLVARSP